MRESSAVLVHFLEEYQRLNEKVNNTLRDYLGDPGVVQTRNLRAAVRRLDSAIRVLPKKTREEKAVKRCHERCVELLKVTSRIRDLDILEDRIAKHPRDATVTLLLNNLQEEREEFVSNSTSAAWKLFEHHPPSLVKGHLPRLTGRVEDVVKKLDDDIARELQEVVKDPARVEELHSLRKHCKRLRYTLELFPSMGQYSRLVILLRKWQDLLGEIRDSDVIMDYLSRAKPTDAVRAMLASERSFRQRRYSAFVQTCRRGSQERGFSLLDKRTPLR
ncbi:MAG: CHAD domain-containing protein [Thaumarchaeota archaeon]|nr:CHAD domain-containing protein [Nitrososphaerota archaeon]